MVRRLAKAAGLALIAGTVGGAALLTAEAVAARSRRYAKPDLCLAVRATLGTNNKPPLRMVLLGDSTALGVGVETVEDTVGGQLARMLAEAGGKVSLSTVAVSGARCADLATQVARAQLGTQPNLAVILVGTNDATHLVRPGEAAAALATAGGRLRDAGTAVVVGTCPDLGALRAVAPPLRQIVGWYGRRVARAQASAARGAGGPGGRRPGQPGPRWSTWLARWARCSAPTPGCSARTASTPRPTGTASWPTRCSLIW